MSTQFTLTLTSDLADELLTLSKKGHLPEVTSLEVDPLAVLENAPAGAESITTVLMDFGLQVGAAVTADFVIRYLVSKVGERRRAEVIKVQENSTDDAGT